MMQATPQPINRCISHISNKLKFQSFAPIMLIAPKDAALF